MTGSQSSPASSPSNASPRSHWQLLESFPLTPTITVSSYRSSLTGLRVVHAHVPGPLVMGYFTLATESFTDDGCPHTLEHLIFMGSTKFPYKGILDLVANRNLSQGTNAWTDIDHTCYTLETAGQQGFLSLLPVYLDHILYPTITDSAFVTEVHHITSDGKNAGVVYSEMQARENTDDDIMTRAIHTALYPGHCGYKSETGGLMKDLRTLTVDTIRVYHRGYYRPDNLSICVAGMVELDALFDTLAVTEADIVSRGTLPSMVRPWTTPVPSFTETVEQTLLYPSEDEETGSVTIGWRSCPWSDFDTRTALEMMWCYLTSTSISPVHQRMIEIEHPYCSDCDSSVMEKSEGIHLISFDACNLELIEKLKSEFFALIQEIVDSGSVDMDRVKTVIEKEIRQTLSGYEDQPHSIVAQIAISNFMYGAQPWSSVSSSGVKDLQSEFASIDRLNTLLTKPQSFWTALMREYILDRPHACIIGKPSSVESQRLMTEETARISQQIESLKSQHGEDVLEQLTAKLNTAIDINSKHPPKSLIDSFKSPDLTLVNQHQLFTYRNYGVSDDLNVHNTQHSDYQKLSAIIESQSQQFSSQLPFVVQLDHIPSQFVQFRAFIDTENLSTELKQFLPLYRELMFESPMVMGDRVVSSKELIAMLENELVHYDSNQGLHSSRFSVGAFSQFLTVTLKCEQQHYERGVQWLYHLLHSLTFDRERIRVAVKRMLSSIPELKNDGGSVCKSAMATVNYDHESTSYSANFMRQQSFLKHLLTIVNSNDDNALETAIVAKLQELKSTLSDSRNIRFHAALDFTLQSDRLLAAITKHFSGSFSSPSPLTYLSKHLNLLKGSENYLLAVPACESSYLSLSFPLSLSPTHSLSYQSKELIPLRVCIEYLTTLEGPLWRRIRGLGFSYSYSIRCDVEAGILSLVLFKSTNLFGAYNEAETIIREFLTNKMTFNDSELVSAKSSLGFEILSGSDTMTAAADQSFIVSELKAQSPYYSQRLLEGINSVSVSDLEAVVSKFLAPLFDCSQSRMAIATNPANVSEIVSKMGEKGRAIVAVKDNKKWFETGDASATAAGEGEEDSDEDDDEEGSEGDEDDEDDDDAMSGDEDD